MKYHPLDEHQETKPQRGPVLLAVDLGLRSGVASFTQEGRLISYRSTNFGTVTRLKRGVTTIIPKQLAVLITEGDSHLASIWERLAEKRGAISLRVAPHEWRHMLYGTSELIDGCNWKQKAVQFAEHVISWSGCPRPTSLRHDAAEAICIGLCGVIKVGWLPGVPEELQLD